MSNSHKRLDYRWYTWPVFLLILLGLIDTAYLAWSHYHNYTDISYSSFCALSKAVNCDTVSQSPWSVLFGVPVAIWGFWGHLLYGYVFLFARKRDRERIALWSLLFLLGMFYSITSVYFGYVSATKIHSYCILCIFNFALIFILFFYSWIILRRFTDSSFVQSMVQGLSFLGRNKILQTGLAILVTLFIIIKIFLPQYWTFVFPPPSSEIATGKTEQWHPWIGAENPVLTIEEYSDYQCFQCYKSHFMLRQLISKYPHKIRLIHHHFPLDHKFNAVVVPKPFHIGSGKMSLLAIYAGLKDNFWKMNDLMYDMGRNKKPFNTKVIAEKTDMTPGELSAAIQNPTVRKLLQRDIWHGMKLGIIATPSFVIDGEVYTGSIPPDLIKRIIQ